MVPSTLSPPATAPRGEVLRQPRDRPWLPSGEGGGRRGVKWPWLVVLLAHTPPALAIFCPLGAAWWSDVRGEGTV